jgi:glutamate dehydrogenase
MDSEATVDHFSGPVQALMGRLPELMTGRELEGLLARRDALVEHGVTEELATRVACLDPAISLLGIVETATRDDLDPAEVARVHFSLGERLGVPLLMQRIYALPREDRWQTMARAAIRDDLHAVHTQLTARVLDTTPAEQSAAARIGGWEEEDAVGVGRATATLQEICSDDTADLARLSVGLRVVRGLLSNG